MSPRPIPKPLPVCARLPSDAEEFDAYVRAPMSDAEREAILESIAWFMRRYPTPGERLAAARRAYAQWAKGMPRVG